MTRQGGMQRPWVESELLYLTAHYGKLTPAEIGAALRRSTVAILGQAARLGLLGRRTAAIRSIKHDHSASVATSIQAYVLGLLAADGCVSPTNQIRLALHRKDAGLD